MHVLTSKPGSHNWEEGHPTSREMGARVQAPVTVVVVSMKHPSVIVRCMKVDTVTRRDVVCQEKARDIGTSSPSQRLPLR